MLALRDTDPGKNGRAVGSGAVDLLVRDLSDMTVPTQGVRLGADLRLGWEAAGASGWLTPPQLPEC